MIPLLNINKLTVSAHSDQVAHQIVNDVTLTMMPGTLHVLMGPNGSGKSSLASTIMGYPPYEVARGKIYLNSQDITLLPIHKRAQLGLFLALQQPPEIPGVTVLTFLKESYAALHKRVLSVNECKALLEPLMIKVQLDSSFLTRSLNEGFSGGEKKKCELLQMLFLDPAVAILDEIDSGIDIDGIRLIADIINKRQTSPDKATLLITHSPHLLAHISPDVVHIMHKGSLAYSGDASIIKEVSAKGYHGLLHL